MDLWKYLLVLVCFCLDSAVSGGGHGGKKHEIIKIHVPEIIEHKHHTKYIVIHHHPKKHHHHHKSKPHIPKLHGHHHFFYHKKKGHKNTHTSTHTHGHGHHGHGHHGHGHHAHKPHKEHKKPQHEPEQEDEYVPFTPQSYYPQPPKVYGVTHTFKEVKMYDSLPFSPAQSPYGGSGHGGGGYQVTEEEEDGGYPNFGSGYHPQPQHDPFSYSPMPAAAHPSVPDYASQYGSNAVPGAEFEYSSGPSDDSYGGLGGGYDSGYAYGAQDVPVGLGQEHFTDEHKQFMAGLQPEETLRKSSQNTPVSYERASGVRETVKTAGHQTVVY